MKAKKRMKSKPAILVMVLLVVSAISIGGYWYMNKGEDDGDIVGVKAKNTYIELKDGTEKIIDSSEIFSGMYILPPGYGGAESVGTDFTVSGQVLKGGEPTDIEIEYDWTIKIKGGVDSFDSSIPGMTGSTLKKKTGSGSFKSGNSGVTGRPTATHTELREEYGDGKIDVEFVCIVDAEAHLPNGETLTATKRGSRKYDVDLSQSSYSMEISVS